MVWIHGGAFSIGNAIEYKPNRYMEHDIVLVVVQYRLGPLGKSVVCSKTNMFAKKKASFILIYFPLDDYNYICFI